MKQKNSVFFYLIFLCFSYSISLGQNHARNTEDLGITLSKPIGRTHLILPKRKSNFDFSQIEAQPIISYKGGEGIAFNGDSVRIHSIEIGVGFGKNDLDNWFWGCYSWSYFTLPYITAEVRIPYKYYQSKGNSSENWKMNPIMLNIGISGGAGISFFYILPIGISGNIGLSSDFNQLYARAGLGVNVYGVNIGGGIFYSLTKRSTVFNTPHYAFMEISFTLLGGWRLWKRK